MNNNLAKLFLIISLFFGILLVFMVPSFNSPDEDSHFLYAYEISEGNLIPKVKKGVSGFYVPDEIFDYISKSKEINGDREKKYTYDEMYYDQLLPQNYEKKQFSNAVIQSSPKLAYLAPALGIITTKFISPFGGGDVSTSVMLQFARFFSLLIYSIIGYFAIKITPKFKKTFFVVLLMPLSLFLRSMVTYDGIILVVSALALANILKLINNEDAKFTKKDFILFALTGFIMLNVKGVYSIIFLGLFAIPSEVFRSKKDKIKTIFKIGILILLITFLKQIPYLFLKTTNNNPYPSKQIEFILSHPLGYIKILLANIIGQIKIQEYWMIGTYGYLDTYMPTLFVFIMNVYLFIVFIIDAFYEKIILPLWLKIGYILLIIFDICGMYTQMYVNWTPVVTGKVGGSEITGIQGRYFLPFLLLVPIILNNNLLDKIFKKGKVKNYIDKLKNMFDNNFHYITITSLIIVIFIIFIRYYC